MPPRPLPVALQAHRLALGACRRCALGPGVRPVVSDTGEPVAMLVGQAPGKSEMRGGRPFVGSAGRTLFRWFERAGWDEPAVREHVYISAITRCYPGPHPAGRGDRVPSPSERHACAPWLDAEVQLVRPAVVIPVGRLAIDRFLGPRPLASLIGQRRDIELGHGRVAAVPLPHPSGASGWLNAPAHRRLLDDAIALLGAALDAVVPHRREVVTDRRTVA